MAMVAVVVWVFVVNVVSVTFISAAAVVVRLTVKSSVLVVPSVH
jgi:hypothetical protein